MTKFFGFVVIAIFLVGSMSEAEAFEGDWEYRIEHGREFMILGDNGGSGDVLELGGTTRYCEVLGDSYAKMHNVLRGNGQNGQLITWWIANECSDGYVRVCIEHRHSEVACSTYIKYGWVQY